jgi:hypothetical protein
MAGELQYLGADGSIALGDAFLITLTIYKNGQVYVPTVTDAIALFKRDPNDSDAAAVITKRLGSGITVNGSTATIAIASTDQTAFSQTTTLWWACRILESNGDDTTIARGLLTLALASVRTPL